jgi:CheY-like chemotaxis protein
MVRRDVIERARSLRPGRDFGYGLDHVFDIIERHGGTLAIDSELGKGTRVQIRLRASRFQIIPPSAKAGARALTPEQSVRIVLVDDSPRLLTVVSDMLRAAGHTVTTSTSGEEALALFDPSMHDVVITDLGMPRMNGWEIAERVKQRSSSTAVFILTGWGERSRARVRRFVDRVIASQSRSNRCSISWRS